MRRLRGQRLWRDSSLSIDAPFVSREMKRHDDAGASESVLFKGRLALRLDDEGSPDRIRFTQRGGRRSVDQRLTRTRAVSGCPRGRSDAVPAHHRIWNAPDWPYREEDRLSLVRPLVAVSSLQVRTASDAPPVDRLAVAAEELGVDGAYYRVHHFAQQLGSPFPLLSAVGARTNRIEIGTAVIDMRYENPFPWSRMPGPPT